MNVFTDGWGTRYAGSIAATAILAIALLLWLRYRKSLKRKRSFTAAMDKTTALYEKGSRVEEQKHFEQLLDETLRNLPAGAAMGTPSEPIGFVEVNVVNGWVTVKLDAVMASSPNLPGVLAEFIDKLPEWEQGYKSGWFHGIHAYSRTAMVIMAVRMKETMTDEDQVRLRRKLTASAILYDHAIPKGLFLLDSSVVEMILRFQALTQRMEVNPEEMDKWREYLPVSHLIESVHRLLCNPILMENITADRRPPSLVYIRESLGLKVDLAAEYSEDQLRKLLTCVYLAAGLSVPRDCLYVDMDVHDYLVKAGEYEWHKEHTTTVL